MAQVAKNLAISTFEGDAATPCRLLFAHTASSRAPRSTGEHVHPFWQMEVATRGRFHWESDGQRHPFGAGEVLLIPPDTPHAFVYPNRPVAWATFKFNAHCPWSEPGPRWLVPRGFLVSALALLVRSVKRSGRGPRTTTAGLLATVLAEISPAPTFGAGDVAVDHALDVIRAAEGRAQSVEEVARTVGMSPGHLSARVRQRTGRSLKGHIDARRAERARELICYSDSRIGEIASELEFPDIFAFSRFVSKHCGAPPTALRHKWRGMGAVGEEGLERVKLPPSHEKAPKRGILSETF